MSKHKCQDCGDNPLCLGDADERYTMNFDDIGEPPIYWCAYCGPQAKAMNDTLMSAFKTRGPEFVNKFEAAVETARAKIQIEQKKMS